MTALLAVVCDIDGVLHKGDQAIPGAARFMAELQRSGREYLLLTNSCDSGGAELSVKLRKFGLKIPKERFRTAIEEIADFVVARRKRPRVHLIGGPAMRRALQSRGAVFVDRAADFVVVGGGGDYDVEALEKAAELIAKGARFITANRDARSPAASGLRFGCGPITAPLERALGQAPYVLGKPNHLMIRSAERILGCPSSRMYMIGDNLETDVDVGVQAQMKTILVLSGATTRAGLKRSPVEPDYVFSSVARIPLRRLP